MKGKKLTIEFVEKIFKSVGLQLLETKYINSSTKMKALCSKHGEIMHRYDRARIGKGCPKCGRDISTEKHKLTLDYVRGLFETKGYDLLETEYINNTVKMEFMCRKHNKKGSVNVAGLNKSIHNCKYCVIDLQTGDKSHLWRGGVTSLTRYLRPHLSFWVQQQFKRTNYRCELTNKQGTLNVHHMFSFKKILDITMNELNMDTRETIGDYTEYELQLITVNLIKNNDILANPKVLLESVHQEFHSFCGGNHSETSQEQWNSFVLQRNKGELS